MNGVVASIDPGVTGAVAFVGEEVEDVHDLPVVQVHSKKCVNGYALRELFGMYTLRLIVVELQGVRPGQGISSSGQTMMIFGGVLATALSMGVPVEIVHPTKWKRQLGLLNRDKEASRHKALRRFPKLKDKLKRKKDHNRGEALLLAHWGKTIH